jgi:hypothetical protein
METPAQTLKRIVNRKPEKCETLGDSHWLHPIDMVEQLVLDGQLREIFARTNEKIKDENIREQVLSQGLTIGTIQLSLRDGGAPGAGLVFPTFEEAYAALANKPEDAYTMFDLYARTFDLTLDEKKI